MIKLLKNAMLYGPEAMGKQDVIILGNKIGHIAPEIPVPQGVGEVEVIDCAGKAVTPGFIDWHVHITGGGGEGGPTTRTPEITLSKITRYGVTTVVGCLGTDGTTRSMEALLAKARALEIEGITTFIYTGAYEVPTRTISGNVRNDVILIDKVIGVGELAISDHRSSHPMEAEIGRYAAEARVGGLLGGKPGLCHFHVGPGRAGIQPVFDLLEHSDIPISQFLPTHMGRSSALIAQGVRFAKMGGQIDFTAGGKVVANVLEALNGGAPLERVTISSDGNGSMPKFDAAGNLIGLGVGSIKTVYDAFLGLMQAGLTVSQTLQIVSANQARVMLLKDRKGCLKPGADADLIVFGDGWQVDQVWAKGRKMVAGGEPIVWGTFEQDIAADDE